jgi:hypothetical protein
MILRDKQQRALPFFPPYIWREGYCGRCGDETFLDDKFPVGWCEGCVKEEHKYEGKAKTAKRRQESLDFFLKTNPEWRY